MTKRALYLAGGGARGAYQAGILKGIGEIIDAKTLPFNMLSGVSVGSINAIILAEQAADFKAGIEKLEFLWQNLSCDQIFKSSNYALGRSVLRNLGHLLIKQRQAGCLLDTDPLRDLMRKEINFRLIEKNIVEQHLEVMEVIAHCYESQQTISFYRHQGPYFKDWRYPRHVSQETTIQMEHILASSALPLFFPSVKINGLHYGDGSIGLVSPLRGAIRFQMDKILILGLRQFSFVEAVPLQHDDLGFAYILGGMLNGLFLDNLDRDIEMVNRMNEISRLLSLWKKRRSPWRPIDTLYLRPSLDMASLAQNQYQAMPGLLRLLLNLMGAKQNSGDLLSFLLFEKEFTSELIQLGYKDALNASKEIERFFA